MIRRDHRRALAALVAMAAVGTAVGTSIAVRQGAAPPWRDRYTLQAEVATANAVVPGRKQPVEVAGVRVGEVTGVTLADGRARITLAIERAALPAVHTGARIALRPATPLNDMTVALDPGLPSRPRLPDGATLGIAQTTPSADVDAVLRGLDADTRRYVQVLVVEGGRAARGRGPDLRRLLEAGAPVARDVRTVAGALADRDAELRRVSGRLRRVGDALAARDRDLATAVDASASALNALAGDPASLRTALARLPPTLEEARGAIDAAGRLSAALPGLAADLQPALEAAPRALEELAPALAAATPVLRDEIRPLVRTARPLAAALRPAIPDLADAAAPAGRALRVAGDALDILAGNPAGPEEGFLFWLAWAVHNSASVVSVEDAHGVAWRGQLLATCTDWRALLRLAPPLAAILPVPDCGGRG